MPLIFPSSRHVLLVVVGAWALLPSARSAGQWQALFDGGSTAAWRTLGKSAEAPVAWRVEEGALAWVKGGGNLATVFHASCHSVSIYPSNPGISADWPGPASRAMSAAFGGEGFFLQGASGDITPWRRGPQAVAEMAEAFARKAREAEKLAVGLRPMPIRVARADVDLPLTPDAIKRTGTPKVTAEVQVLVCGPLAFVALPGEPLTDLGTHIREDSPFPQTLVLGYSNGMGVHYVGMPGEKARGGYEAGVAGAGTDECGRLLVDAAVRLLREIYASSGYPGKR